MLLVRGGQTLSGSVTVSGSKNAALPLIAAALFFKKATLRNVPDISDVRTLLAIVRSVGAKAEFENNVLRIETGDMKKETMDLALVSKIRASIMLVPAFLKAF